MTSRLIRKIETEQIETDKKAFAAGIAALGFDSVQQRALQLNYRWMTAISRVRCEVNTPRVQKTCVVAQEAYLQSLASAIQSLPRPLKLSDWTRAGQAMMSVFQTAAKVHLKD